MDDTPAHRRAFAARSGDDKLIGTDGTTRNLDQEARDKDGSTRNLDQEARDKAEAEAKRKPKPGWPSGQLGFGANAPAASLPCGDAWRVTGSRNQRIIRFERVSR